MGPSGLGQQMQAANEAIARTRSSNLPDPVVFKKGATRSDSLHEEPTLVSFFFLFHFDYAGNDESISSPLFAPATKTDGTPIKSARNFFEKTLANSAPDYAADKLARLNSFQAILKKVNTEMPWFFQTVTGLELARQYNEEEPWRGVDKPKIEIECLEENIEFTATKMMSLYRNVVWDDKRMVRIIPTNIAKFTMDVYVTEIRNFQANTASPLLGSNRGSTAYANLSNQDQDSRSQDKIYAQGFLRDDFTAITVGETKPVFAIRLKQCEFDMNSGQELFADLSKNPEYKKPKIGIYYKSAEVLWENGGPNLPLDKKLKEFEIISTGGSDISRNPFDPADDVPKIAQAIGNLGKDAAEKAINTVGGAIAKLKNMSRLTTGNSAIGNAHGVSFAGPLATFVEGATPDFGSLFLGNVHGLNLGSTLQDAINTASLNALGGLGSDVFSAIKTKFGTNAVSDMQPANIYDNLNVGGLLPIPGSTNLSNVYDGINTTALDSSPDGNINDNVYGNTPAVDSTPDGNLNQNVYE